MAQKAISGPFFFFALPFRFPALRFPLLQPGFFSLLIAERSIKMCQREYARPQTFSRREVGAALQIPGNTANFFLPIIVETVLLL
jgi:hypothetical protein